VTTVVRNDPDNDRYVIVVDDELAGFTQYRLEQDGTTITFVHTEIDRRFEGQGLGSKLAAGALDDVRERGLQVVAECEFIAGYLERHRDQYADLLARTA
jgi:predicted GNAT family acetyltransferase